MRVVLINNYDLMGILKSFQEEQENAPAQHLWGYTLLEKRGICVDILPFEKHGWLKQFSQKVKFLGDLDQQLRLLTQLDRYDVIYSAHHLTTLFLAFLRSIKLLNIPIIAIAYQTPAQKTWFWKLFTQMFVQGNDKILCLSEALAKDLKEFGVPEQKLELIAWGPDLRFYQPDFSKTQQPHWFEQADQPLNQLPNQPPDQPKFIFSLGKTYRDYSTLLKAFQQIDCQLTICASRAISAADVTALSLTNVTLYEDMIPWRGLIELYQQAYAVAIPLTCHNDKFNNAIGLTALTEAMATGNAIVMTRNEYVGIDIEKEGIGLWVNPGDSQGWQKAITYLLENPALTQEMGRKARLLAEKKFNLVTFSNQLAATLEQFDQLPHAKGEFLRQGNF